jgi:UDP-N-acetylmuramate--alanine ligase
VGTGKAFVSEVDESDGSIALYRPQVAVLNNVSLDHKGLDELRQLFGDFLGHARVAVVNADNADARTLGEVLPTDKRLFFSVEGDAALSARTLREEPFGIRFDLHAHGDVLPVTLQVPGRHNVSNALAAIGAAIAAGVSAREAAEAIGGFAGLRRRIELVGQAAGVAVIDDFGHNPDKIAATLDALHAFPGRVLMLFQPHGFGPLKLMGRELAETFTSRMRDDDLLVMPDPVYQGGTVSREVGSEDIVAMVTAVGRDARHVPDRAEAARLLVDHARPGDRVVVMGARDDTLSLLAEGMVRELAAR